MASIAKGLQRWVKLLASLLTRKLRLTRTPAGNAQLKADETIPDKHYIRTARECAVTTISGVAAARKDKSELSERPRLEVLDEEIANLKASFPGDWYIPSRREERTLFLGRADKQLNGLEAQRAIWQRKKKDYEAMRPADLSLDSLEKEREDLAREQGEKLVVLQPKRSHKKKTPTKRPQTVELEAVPAKRPKRTRAIKKRADDSDYKPDTSEGSSSSDDSDGDHAQKKKKPRKLIIPPQLQEWDGA